MSKSIHIEWQGDQVLSAVRAEVADSLRWAASHLRAQSAAEAPVDTGRLRASCVADTGGAGDGRVVVGYHPRVDSYAMRQHETIGYRHPRGGKPKFLEDPLNQNRAAYTAGLAAAVRRGMRVE